MKSSKHNLFLFPMAISWAFTPLASHSAGVEVAGALAVDLRADHPSAGTATWDNIATSNTAEDFTLFSGGDPIKTTISGVDFVRLDPDDNYVGPDAPESATGAGPRSIEVWVKNDAVADEEIMVAWGKRGAEPQNYAFSYGTNGIWGALGGWGSGDVPWYQTGPGAPAPAALHHLVITYDGTTTRLYSDGVLTNSRVHALNTFNDPNKIIINGAWEGDNSTIQRPNSGEMDYSVIRVHTGSLTDAQVLANYQAGWGGSVVIGPKWTGATADWGTGGNWDSLSVPSSSQAVIFGTTGAGATATLDTGRTQTGLGFDAAVSTTIDGAFPLTLDNGTSFAPVEATGTHVIGAPLVLASPVKLDVAPGGTLSISGGISGTQDLTKIGLGTLEISGTNTRTGNTFVDAGTLNYTSGSVASPVTVRSAGVVSGTGNPTLALIATSGGTVAPGGTGTVGATTVKSLTMNNGGVLAVDFGAGNDTLTITDALTINSGAVRVLMAGTSNPFMTNGTYTVATFGSIAGSVSNLFVANAAAGHTYGFSVVGNSLVLTVSSAPVWNGEANPNTQWSNALNWSGVAVSHGSRLEFASAPTAPASNNDIVGGFYQSLLFGATSSAYQVTGSGVTLTGDGIGSIVTNDSAALQAIALPLEIPNPSSVTANGGAVTISGAISGTGSLVKKGTKLLTLSGANTFSGGVIVQPGNAIIGDNATLIGIGSASALGTGPLTLPSAGLANLSGGPLTLSTANAQTWSGQVSFTGPALNMGASAATLADHAALTIDSTLTIGGITGSSNLTIRKGILSLISTAAPQEIHLGWDSTFSDVGGEGELRLTEGTPSISVGTLRHRSDTKAHLLMSTGTLNISGDWRLGHDGYPPATCGSAVITGGTINHTGGVFDMGFNGAQSNVTFGGNSTYNGDGRLLQMGFAWQSRSTLTIKDTATVTSGEVRLGDFNDVPDSFNLSSLTVRDSATFNVNGDMFLGRQQGGTGGLDVQFNQQGGSTTVTGAVRLSQTGGNPGLLNIHLNLLGGTFTSASVNDSAPGSVLSFQGGALKITTANSIAADHIYVYQDAKIDTGANDIFLSGPLESPVDSGVSSVAIAQGGTGYQLIPPMVRFSGGSGSGATGVANVDPVTGAVTGISITCPGSGYLAGQEPVIQLFGGGGTGAAAGVVSLASNSSFTGGLSKSGVGKLTVVAASNYRGDTNVQEGTLTLTTDTLNDNSTVRLGAGSTLDLQTGGSSDTVRKFFIGGVQQAAGVWGAEGTDVEHETTSIIGDGFLVVTESGGTSPFQSWISSPSFGLAVADQDLGDDPDNDGTSNLLEFAFKGNPASGTTRGLRSHLLQDTNASGTKELTLVAAIRRGGAFSAGPNGTLVGTVDGVTYTVSGSQDLIAFDKQVSVVGPPSDTAPAGTGMPSLAGEDWQYWVFKLDASEGLSGKGFLRIKAE
ncbi:MAG: LamG-like jellyroll fold domain-containing protein [Verrucomicrobiota bacterium]